MTQYEMKTFQLILKAKGAATTKALQNRQIKDSRPQSLVLKKHMGPTALKGTQIEGDELYAEFD